MPCTFLVRVCACTHPFLRPNFSLELHPVQIQFMVDVHLAPPTRKKRKNKVAGNHEPDNFYFFIFFYQIFSKFFSWEKVKNISRKTRKNTGCKLDFLPIKRYTRCIFIKLHLSCACAHPFLNPNYLFARMTDSRILHIKDDGIVVLVTMYFYKDIEQICQRDGNQGRPDSWSRLLTLVGGDKTLLYHGPAYRFAHVGSVERLKKALVQQQTAKEGTLCLWQHVDVTCAIVLYLLAKERVGELDCAFPSISVYGIMDHEDQLTDKQIVDMCEKPAPVVV